MEYLPRAVQIGPMAYNSKKPLPSADIKYHVFLCYCTVDNNKGQIKSFKMAQTRFFYLY